jgi:hypothetical protein
MGNVTQILEILALLFLVALGTGVLGVLLFYVVDRMQPGDAIRRNYPVIGRFRGLFTKLGEFFRQYFFAMDREEMPFNRAQRDWVAHATRGTDNTIAFGSTRNLQVPGTPIFVPAVFPPLDDQFAATIPMEIGRHELWCHLAPRRRGAEPGGRKGGYLAQYRRGGPQPLSPDWRLRHRLSDRHREIRGARRRGAVERRQAARGF